MRLSFRTTTLTTRQGELTLRIGKETSKNLPNPVGRRTARTLWNCGSVEKAPGTSSILGPAAQPAGCQERPARAYLHDLPFHAPRHEVSAIGWNLRTVRDCRSCQRVVPSESPRMNGHSSQQRISIWPCVEMLATSTTGSLLGANSERM